MDPQKVVAFFWFRNADEFERLRELSEDRGQFMDSYALWLQAAENGFEEMQGSMRGVKVVKIHVDPDDYLAWCRAGSQNINAASRTGYANFKAFEMFRDGE